MCAKLKRFEMKESSYNTAVGNMTKNGSNIMEVIVGQRKKLYKLQNDTGDKKLMAIKHLDTEFVNIGKLSGKSFNQFLAEFKLNLHNNLKKNSELLNLNIPFKGITRKKNIQFWDTMPIGTYFYGIDFKSAYWQMGHKIGYIDSNLYNGYMDLDDYKEGKRLCFSFLARKITGTYHKLNTSINCDISCYMNVYNNVRNLLYNYMADVVKLSENMFIEYNIDGIYVMKDKIDVIKDYLKENNIVSKRTICKKINDAEYISGYTLVEFLKPKK